MKKILAAIAVAALALGALAGLQKKYSFLPVARRNRK